MGRKRMDIEPTEDRPLASRLAGVFPTVKRVVSRTKEYVRRIDRGYVFLIPPAAVYVVVWSWISISKFYGLFATVYDLGLEMQGIWAHTQVLSTPGYTYAMEAITRPVSFLLVPFAVIGSYPLLLVFQAIALASGAFAIYGIATRVWESRLASYTLALSYLIYFPLSGVNAFDFHVQILFIPGFLFGYLFFLRGQRKSCFALMFLAGASTFGYMVLVIGFAALTLVEWTLEKRRHRASHPREDWRFMASLLVAATAYFALQDLYFSSYLGGAQYIYTAVVYTPASASFPLWPRIEVLILLVAPLCGLVLLSPKWLALLAPFAFLVLHSSAPAYGFPTIFHVQLPTMAIPAVYIGSMYGAKRLAAWMSHNSHTDSDNARPVEVRPRRRGLLDRELRGVEVLAIVILAVCAASATVYEPYGPLNSYSNENYDLGHITTINWTTYAELQDLISLVPRSTPYVLFQNDMPTVLPRPLEYHQTPLTSALLDWLNATPYDASVNRFPLSLDGAFFEVPILYTIANPWSIWYEIGGGRNDSMSVFVQSMISSGEYGLLGEAGGMMVLARGYTGPLLYYAPLAQAVPASSFRVLDHHGPSGLPVISESDLINQTAWYGPYTYLPPGEYRVTWYVETSNDSPSNSIELAVSANAFHTVLGRLTLTGANFTSTNTWTAISLDVDAPSIYSLVEFPGRDAFWNGTLSFRGVSVQQVGQPAPLFP